MAFSALKGFQLAGLYICVFDHFIIGNLQYFGTFVSRGRVPIYQYVILRVETSAKLTIIGVFIIKQKP